MAISDTHLPSIPGIGAAVYKPPWAQEGSQAPFTPWDVGQRWSPGQYLWQFGTPPVWQMTDLSCLHSYGTRNDIGPRSPTSTWLFNKIKSYKYYIALSRVKSNWNRNLILPFHFNFGWARCHFSSSFLDIYSSVVSLQRYFLVHGSSKTRLKNCSTFVVTGVSR